MCNWDSLPSHAEGQSQVRAAFEMIVLFNHGQILGALDASASTGFVIGALAMGLATARFYSPR